MHIMGASDSVGNGASNQAGQETTTKQYQYANLYAMLPRYLVVPPASHPLPTRWLVVGRRSWVELSRGERGKESSNTGRQMDVVGGVKLVR